MISIVGGGITGLTLGWELARRNIDFQLFEACEEVGGVMRSAVVDGHVLDWGPQRARLTPALMSMIAELGLDDDVVTAPNDLELFVYRGGSLRAVPFALKHYLFSDVVGPGAKLRALFEPLTGAARPGERVSEYFTRKFGREIYESIIGPLYGGLYSSDPANMDAGRSLVPVLRQFGIRRSLLLPLLRRGGSIDPPPACTFRAGMQTLPDAIAGRLGSRVRTGTPVRGLTRCGERWRLQLGDGTSVESSRVVLTAPADVSARLLRPLAPSAADALERLVYNPLAIVHVEAETSLRGTGFKVAFGDANRRLALTGVTFNDSLFGRDRLYTVYLGGAANPDVVGLDDEDLASLAVRDFRITTGFDSRPVSVARTRVPAWDMSWQALDGLVVPHGIDIAANWWSRPGLPGRFNEAGRLAEALAAASGVGEEVIAGARS